MEMNQTSKICISGIGLITPLGQRVEENWNAISNGVTADDFNIKNFRATEYIKRRYLRPLDAITIRCIAMVAAAMEDSGADIKSIDPRRVGLVLGSVFAGIGCIFDFKQTCYEARESNYIGLSPLYFPGIVFNSLSGQPAIEFGFAGPNSVVNNGLSSGLLAVIKGAEYIMTGKADVIIAGGAEMKHPFIDKKYNTQKDTQSVKSLGSDFSISEATCVFVLHREGDPGFSSATRYGTIESWRYGFFPNGYSVKQLNKAISSLPNIDYDSVDTVVMDAYRGSKLGEYEYQAIDSVFSGSNPTLLNNKKYFGHTLGASGSLNLFHGLLHSRHKREDKNKILVNSLDPDGNYAFITLNQVSNNDR